MTLEERAREFNAQNPGVYYDLVSLARYTKARGATKCGISMLWEVLRWKRMTGTARDPEGFKLNNSYRAWYARMIMDREPDLVGFFETRRAGSDD